MKRHVLFTLSLLYVTICFAYPTWPTRVDGICYICNDDDMTARVVEPFNYQGELMEYVGDIVIPEEIAPNRPDFKYTVTEIDEGAFINNVTTSVVIPGTVDDIRYFRSCTNLRKVTFNHGIQEIWSAAFTGLQHLESVVFNSTISTLTNHKTGYKCEIHSGAFYGCSALKHVDMGKRVTSVGDYAFGECKSLTTVHMSNRLTSIGEYAFGECSALTSVNIPNSVTQIGVVAFSGCSSLTTVHMGNSVTSVGDDAFRDCRSLTSVHITDLSAWCNISFANWSSNPLSYAGHLYLNGNEIKDLVIPDGVTTISQLAFSNCMGLTSVTIPNSVTSIGDYAFENCPNLISVPIPNSVTSIGDYAFGGCESLASVTIPNSVTYIGSSVFEYCESLTSVSIGSGLKSISAYAFSECSALTDITIPEGVTSISEGAFGGCGAMTSINIPSSVTSIGERAFDGCRALEAVHITDLSAWCRISYATDVYSDWAGELINRGNLEYSEQPLYYAHHLYLNNQEIKDLIIPEDVTCVSNLAFAGCSGLSSITIPGTVKSLGAGAFYQCGLAKIIVPDIAAWCNMSFEGYGSNPIPFVGSLYSDAETEITNLVIPSGVTWIGDGAFLWCWSLTSVTIPEGVTNIGQGAFSNCVNLASVTLPESVARIDSSAFNGCGALTDIKIPKSTTSIGNWAFTGCNFTAITIPENLTSIGYAAFWGCPLTSVYCCATEPPIAVYDYGRNGWNYFHCSFDISHIEEHTTLYVPESSLESYSTTAPWSNFKNIVALTQDEIDGIQEIKNESLTHALSKGEGDWYSLDGKKLGKPQSGIKIIRFSDGTSKKVLVK